MTPAASTPVIGYARVSSTEQGDSRLGLEAQEAAIRAECERRGWLLVDLIHEVGSGRSTTRRPLLQGALSALDAKDGPQAIVVAKLDRLTRSFVDAGRLFERSEKKKWDIVALDLGIDTGTAAGRLMRNLMVSVGQWEREVIAERTSAALRAKVARGESVGRPRSMPTSTLDAITRMRGEGQSYTRIAEALNDQGIPGAQGGRWFKQSVRAACMRYGVGS